MNIHTELSPQRTKGRARLATKNLGGRTKLDVFFQEGAAKIRMPESFDGRMEAVLINTSGGLTGGDRIEWDVETGRGTDLTVTTQACERIYKASSGVTRIETKLTVGDGSALHWLPQETILFNEGALERRLDVDVATGSEFLCLEAVLLGRKAMGESVRHGLLRDRWRIRVSGKLVHAEELCLQNDIDAMLSRRAVLSDNLSFATLLFIAPRAESLLERLRELLAGEMAGVSFWNGKLIVRLVATEGFELRKILLPVISLLRNDRPPPKVWHI